MESFNSYLAAKETLTVKFTKDYEALFTVHRNALAGSIPNGVSIYNAKLLDNLLDTYQEDLKALRALFLVPCRDHQSM